MSNATSIKKVTSKTLLKMKLSGERITMLTAYDYSSAKYIDESGIDAVLIGDSLGMTMLGYKDTVNVTMEEMEIFTSAVSRGVNRAMIVADMPFLSFQISKEQTLVNAGRLIRSGANAVKLEGANDFILEQIAFLTQAGIGVIGHLGFTPQYINTIGGYFVQGKSLENTIKLLELAKKIEQAGAVALVLEMVSEESSKYISEQLTIPTIGIGSGRFCDGQVLVIDDILGRYHGNTPKFVKKYADLQSIIKDSVKAYINDVKTGEFPQESHVFKLTTEEREKFDNEFNR